jgi:hypothetical protein
MIIETWILAIIIIFMGVMGIVSVLGWTMACSRNEELKAMLDEAEKYNAELHKEIRYMKIKNNVQVASDYYNEGE